MTTTALVAGPSRRACDVAAALQAQGFATITVDNGAPVREACDRVSPGSVDCFVQLAADAGPGGVAGLLSLVDAVAAVAPLLADHATVVIMAANGSDVPYRRDRILDDAVGVLAEAVMADHGSDGVRVSVLDARQSPADIAAAARGQLRPRSGPSLADFEPDLGYADWRSQVLSLSSVDDATYFGWRGADGRSPVAIIRGAVVSPLRPVGAGSGPGLFSWGHSGPGTVRLARALLVDILGGGACCPACGGAGDDCRSCGSTGCSEPVEAQVDAFVAEVIAPLGSDGFELPAEAVQTWIGQRARFLRPADPVAVSQISLHRRRRVRRRQRPDAFGAGASPGPVPRSPVT